MLVHDTPNRYPAEGTSVLNCCWQIGEPTSVSLFIARQPHSYTFERHSETNSNRPMGILTCHRGVCTVLWNLIKSLPRPFTLNRLMYYLVLTRRRNVLSPSPSLSTILLPSPVCYPESFFINARRRLGLWMDGVAHIINVYSSPAAAVIALQLCRELFNKLSLRH